MEFQFDNTPRPNILEGVYKATVTKVEPTDEGEWGPQVIFEFDLGEVEDVDGNTEPRTLRGYTSQKLSPGGKYPMSKLWQWALAMNLDPINGFNTDDMIGKTVAIKVTIEPKKSDGELINKVNIVRPEAYGKKFANQPKPAALDVPMGLDEGDAIPAEALEAANW